jgi:hypothetical protein
MTHCTSVLIIFQGTLAELQRLTGWGDDRVLYFGDHPYADLADLVSGQFSHVTSKMLFARFLHLGVATLLRVAKVKKKSPIFKIETI